MRDIEIAEKESRPFINLYGKVKEHSQTMGVQKIHLMLSHDGDYGIANVILEA